MTILINWLIALAVVLLFFFGLYIVIKMAVKSAVREVTHEVAQEMAKKLWEEDSAPKA